MQKLGDIQIIVANDFFFIPAFFPSCSRVCLCVKSKCQAQCWVTLVDTQIKEPGRRPQGRSGNPGLTNGNSQRLTYV